MVFPLLPGKAQVDRVARVSCWHGERTAGYEDARRRPGIKADDLEAAFKMATSSGEPFDRWFRDRVREVHGIALEDGFTPPEQIVDYPAGVAS